ncbi:hypothetical protein FKP32DRAFT_1178223 [Trametes sanguinea]|nr:hypothetical protein FKP32DRAFT_1178223 [Trametes sanguinea]
MPPATVWISRLARNERSLYKCSLQPRPFRRDRSQQSTTRVSLNASDRPSYSGDDRADYASPLPAHVALAHNTSAGTPWRCLSSLVSATLGFLTARTVLQHPCHSFVFSRMRSSPAHHWSGTGGSPDMAIEELCTSVPKLSPGDKSPSLDTAKVVPPFLRKVFRSVSNLSLRSPKPDGGRSPKSPSLSPHGVPYHKGWRPAFYTPALRQPRALAIPEDFSLRLLNAVTRAEERLKATSNKRPVEPTDDPMLDEDCTKDVKVFEHLRMDVDILTSLSKPPSIVDSPSVGDSQILYPSNPENMCGSHVVVEPETFLPTPEAVGLAYPANSEPPCLPESLSEGLVEMMVQDEDAFSASAADRETNEADHRSEIPVQSSMVESAVHAAELSSPCISAMSTRIRGPDGMRNPGAHLSEDATDHDADPTDNSQAALTSCSREHIVTGENASLNPSPEPLEEIVAVPSLGSAFVSPGHSTSEQVLPIAYPALDNVPNGDASTAGPTSGSEADTSCSIIDSSHPSAEDLWLEFPFYNDDFPPIQLPSLPTDLDAALLSVSDDGDDFTTFDIYLVPTPITMWMLFTCEITYPSDVAYPCCSVDARSATGLLGEFPTGDWNALSMSMICVAVLGSVALLYVAFSAN